METDQQLVHSTDDGAAEVARGPLWDALREVILPPLPPEFPRDQETVHARFIADGDVRTMRRFLAQLKRAGYF